MRLLQVATVPEFFWSFFKGQIEYLVKNGFEVHLVCSPGDLIDELEKWPVQIHTINIQRNISPLYDLISFFKLVRLILKIKPAIVHAHTSKAGLIAILASKIAMVPVSIFTIHGYRWVGMKGVRRSIIKAANRITCLLADKVFCVSKSNLKVGVSAKIFSSSNASVLCNGSINGVEADTRFNPMHINQRNIIRAELGIDEHAVVFCFVGRIVHDKGIHELTESWQFIRKEYSDVHLVLIGKIETGDPISISILEKLQNDTRVHMLGFQKDIASYFSAFDVLVLPTYREGFPVTPLEASAMAMPVIATRIPGCIDAVIDGKTGILIKPKDAESLTEAMRMFLRNKELIDQYGRNGREYVLRFFTPEKIWKAIYSEYCKLIKKYIYQKAS